MRKILLSCLVCLTVSCASAPADPPRSKRVLTVCMVYADLGRMRCSTNGEPARDVEYKAADHFICMPNDDAVDVFSRMDSCEDGSLK